MHRFHSGERSEAGDTLIEVLIASALMGIIVIAVIGGLAAVLIGSLVHREQTTGNSVLVSAMERLKSADVDRVPCATPTTLSYAAAVQAAKPAAWSDPLKPGTLTIASITYQKSDPVTYATTLDGPCDDNGTNGLTMQLITVTASPPGGRALRTLSFVKDNN